MAETKRCRRCDTVKPLDQFHANTQALDGKHAHCKPCRAAYFQANKARYTATQRARKARWTAAQRAVSNAYSRAYYARNRDVLREKARLKREAAAQRSSPLPFRENPID